MTNNLIDLTSLDADVQALPPIKRGKSSLLIAIVVSVALLLTAVGIAVWMYTQQNNASSALPTDNTDTKDVAKVTWIAPDTLPANYKKLDENTHNATVTYYHDDSLVCGLTAMVTDIESTTGATAKEAMLNVTKTRVATGVAVTNSTDGDEFMLKDTDGREFTFASLQVTQSVNMENIAFKELQNHVVYKQFGTHLVSIGAACKADTWVTHQAELEALLKQFTVKLER